MCWRTSSKDENVSREQRRRRFTSSTRVNRAEARCWGSSFQRPGPVRPGWPESELKFALPSLIREICGHP